MTAIITFLIGLFIGWALTIRRWNKVDQQRENKKKEEDSRLRYTPDEKLSEVDLLGKRYLQAKDKRMFETISKPLINKKLKS